MEIKSSSPKRTKKIAQKLVKQLKAGDFVALYGDLGAGKTVFVQGLAKGLKVSRQITSPTFVFVKSYPIRFKGKKLTFNHLDLYRIINNQNFESLGIDEFLKEDSITIIEWADKMKEKLPRKRIEVNIEKIDDTARRITITRYK